VTVEIADARGDAAAPAAAAERAPRRRAWLLPWAVVAVAVAVPLRGVFLAPGPPMEEGFMLVFPERVLAGDVPNRDFLHLYGPGSLWVLAAFYKVLGVSLWTERLVGLLQIVGLVAGTTYVGYRWGRWTAAVAGVVTAVIIIPPIGLAALAWVGGLALGLWAVIWAVRVLDAGHDSRRALVVAGALAGAALLYRPDLAIALGLPLGALWIWGLDRPGRRRLLTGLVAGLSPYLVHLAMAGPANAISGMFTEPVFDLRPGRRLPFPPPFDQLTSFLNKAYTYREFPWPLPAPEQPAQLALWFWFTVAVCVALVVIAVRARRSGSPEGWRLLALALFAVGLLPQAVQRTDTAHLAWVSCVPFGLLPAFLAESTRQRGVRAALRVGLALVPAALMLLWPDYTLRWYADRSAQSFGYEEEGFEMQHRGRTFFYGRSDVVAAAEELFADVERLTEPGDRLVVGTGDLRKTPYSEAFLYYMLPQLEPGTRYIEMDPGVANAEDSGLADEMRAADVVILSTINDNWDEPNASQDSGSSEPNRVLDEEFCLEARYGRSIFLADRGLYELYLPCKRDAT
jgi:hypothetical protein